MSELTEKVRNGYLYTDVAKLCDEHERLEAEHALLVRESVRDGIELDRLEGMLRAWAIDGGPNFWTDQRNAVYTEAVRLAKETL